MFLTIPGEISKPEQCLKNLTLPVLVSSSLCPANKCFIQLRLFALDGSLLISVALMSSVSKCFRFPNRRGNLHMLVFLRLKYFSWKKLETQSKVLLFRHLQPSISSTLSRRSCGKDVLYRSRHCEGANMRYTGTCFLHQLVTTVDGQTTDFVMGNQ